MLEPTKKIPHHLKTKKRLQQDGRRSAVMIKSNPIPAEWQTNWRTIIPKKFSYCCEGSELHVRLLSLGIWQRDWKSSGNLNLNASWIWLQDFHRTGEKDSTLGGHKQNLAFIKTQGTGTMTPRRLNQTHVQVLEGLLGKAWVGSGSPQEPGHW